ncbi:MAG TPA: hypothetical protein VMV49_06640 [Candidatus Deferrimicrobium sp.]|nr:hypothetical protein [Candidatus Deferrimicrobium sp.]
MQDEKDYLYAISNEIVNIFGRIFATKPYIAILDGIGNIHHVDEPFSEHLEFIKDFVNKNFKFLQVGDYSFPLGGVNLGFFKISPKAVIVLYTTKGFIGQLLAFKARMHEWSQKIDEVIGDINIPVESVQNIVSEESKLIEERAAIKKRKLLRDVPILIKKISGKEKFSIDTAQVLNFCDGENSIEDICMTSNYNIVKVKEILWELEKKKWIAIKRLLG